MINIGNAVILEPGEKVVSESVITLSDDEVSLVRSAMALIALCPEAYRLEERLANVLGELTNDETFRFTIGEDGFGELAALPA